MARRPHAAPCLTKIIATVGPATRGPEAVGGLIDAGASAFRLNFGHATRADHERHLESIREAARRRDRPVAVIGDLQGPKIRVGPVVEGGVDVAPGAAVTFQAGEIVADAAGVFSCTDQALIDKVETGHRVLVDDGTIHLTVTEKHADRIVCEVIHGGTIRSAKGINLPDTDPVTPPLTDRDAEYVRWAVERDLDFLAQSYVGSAGDVEALKKLIDDNEAEVGRTGCRLPVIAKIERPSAVANADAIIDAADALMIARGDLGVEMDPARVPVIQKQLTKAAARAGKPCIVATQMLQSMIDAHVPTRAEAADVAGAIFDEVDTVMLSGETAVGRYPQLAVDTMRRIAAEAEAYLATLPSRDAAPARLVETGYRTAALAHGAWTVARDLRARLIVVWSQGGGGARYLSQNRFRIPIIAVSSDERALRQMQLLRGVQPVGMPAPADLGEFTRLIDGVLLESGWADRGDACIVMGGEPPGEAGVTNRMAMHWIGNPATGFARP